MKRAFDIVSSFFAIVIFSPLMLIIALCILLDDGVPIIFKQKRVGRNNELFEIRKFRSMKKGTRSCATHELTDSDDVITKTGKFIRKLSLDELPQLFNILGGSMSVVGPRPLIPEEDKIRKMRAEKGIYSLRPGITGLAQINGRDLVSDEQKVDYDYQYLKTQSFFGDIKIIFQTVGVVLARKGFAEGGDKKGRSRSKK